MHRKAQIERRLPVFSLAALVFLALLPAPATAGRAENRALLEQVNEQWEGATARTRFRVRVKRGKRIGDWHRLAYYHNLIPSEGAKGYRLFFWVSDRSHVAPLLRRQGRKQILPAGTELVAEGWRLGKPESGDDLELHLRFPDRPGRVKFTFQWLAPFSWGSVDLKGLEWVERYMRLEFFDLQARQERLVDAPLLPPSEPPPADPGGVTAEMLAVSARPAQVSPGDELELVAHYELTALGGGFTDVTEVREIWRGEERLAAFEEEVGRAPGSHTSVQGIAVTDGLEPGIYSLRIRVVAGGEPLAAGEALFEVR